MKTKKFIAILSIALLFVLFFEIALFSSFGFVTKKTISGNTTSQIQYIEVDRPVYNTANDVRSITAYGLGVHEDNETGELITINISVQPGSGRIFFDGTFHSYGPDLQDSWPSLIDYAERFTGKSLKYYDVKVEVQSVAHTIEGTSGGAAMETALIALLQNKTLRENYAITGTMSEDGSIGPIAGLAVKIKVAEDLGVKTLLVPKSQCEEAENATMDVICVKNIREAVKLIIA